MDTLESPRPQLAVPVGAFRQIGWAFLFLGISITVRYPVGQEIFIIDLLPDFVGYLMIAAAANRLIVVHRRARVVRNLALLLAFLSIPTIVQYAVVTSQSENITTWRAPFWPLTVIPGLLDLVLVWILCGMVAELAQRAGDRRTENRARTCQLAYVLLRIAVLVVLGSALMSPNAALILGAAVVGLGGGLIVLVMMIGLMGRAERLLARSPGVAEHDPEARRSGWIYRLLIFAAVALPVLLAAGGIYYYWEWQQVRDEDMRRTSNGSYFSPAREEFLEPLRAGHIDDAYAATTDGFKKRISRERFGELARQYDGYRKAREQQNRGGGAGVSGGGATQTEYEYAEVEKGKTIIITWTIRRDPDSIFLRTPPPVHVDEFKIEERTGPPQGGLFGQPFGPQR
jgi:hypothetical protein